MNRYGYLAGALALAATVSCALAQRMGTVALTPSRTVAERVVTLEGNVHPLARADFDAGAVSADLRMERMVLLLSASPAQQAELDALVAAQQDTGSPLFHQWLTPAEFGARFGVHAQSLAQVTTWLTQQGFTVSEVPAGNRLVVFSGTAGQVSDAFHIEMRHYVVNGESHIANAQDAQIPAALGGLVSGIVSLHDFRRSAEIEARLPLEAGIGGRPALEPGATAGSQPEYTAGGTHYVFPSDFATIYDLDPLYDAGTTGAGVSIAIAGRSNINLSDVAMFRSVAGLAENVPAVITPQTDPGLVADDQQESTLDVEWSGATAPAASVTLVAEPSTATTDGVDLAAAYIVNHAVASVVSVSYGTCEQEMGVTERAFYNALWEQAAAQGMSVFVASGDAGAAGCSAATASEGAGAAVNGLCSSPYSTCVGGTEFNEGSNSAADWAATNSAGYSSALGYIPEQVWNESALNGGVGLWASGGGVSAVYAQPAWQATVSGTAAANGMRSVPDVALAAAHHDGAVMVEDGSFSIVSGTSVSAPAFAGIMALVTQKMGGTGEGNANPGLYALVDAEQSPFHSTPAGNNSVPGVEGYWASGAAYNLGTGLGSVDASLLADDWVSAFAAQATAVCSRLKLVRMRCAAPQRPLLPR